MAEKNVEINVKTALGYDQLYPVNKTTLVFNDPDMSGWDFSPDSWTYLSAYDIWYVNLENDAITNEYFPIVVAQDRDGGLSVDFLDSLYECETYNGYITVRAKSQPNDYIQFIATLIKQIEIPEE